MPLSRVGYQFFLTPNALYILMAEKRRELQTLLKALKEEAATSEQFSALAEVSKARDEAEKKKTPKVLAALKKAGKWTLDTAVKIGVPVAVEVIKQAMKP